MMRSRDGLMKVFVVVLLGLGLVVLVSCGGGSATEPAPAGEAQPAPATAAQPQGESAAGARTFQIVPEESEASYTVEEEFFSGAVERFGKTLGMNTAVGRTNAIEGQIALDVGESPPSVVSGEFVVDISTLQSDDSIRDRIIRERFLQSESYPQATFVVTGAEGLPANYQPGQEATFKLMGDLTIREVANPATFDVTATLNGDTLSGVATTQIQMTNFGFNPPGFAGMMQAEDEALITLNFTARSTE